MSPLGGLSQTLHLCGAGCGAAGRCEFTLTEGLALLVTLSKLSLQNVLITKLIVGTFKQINRTASCWLEITWQQSSPLNAV